MPIDANATSVRPGIGSGLSDFSTKRGNAAGSAIAVAAGSDRVAKRVHDRSRRMEIRFAEFEMDDGAALTLKFLRARKNGQRAFAV